MYRVAIAVAGGGAALTLISSIILERGYLNVGFGIAATVALLWFTTAFALRSRHLARTPVLVITTFVFAAIPWVTMSLYASHFGLLRAVGTWEPILLYLVLIIVCILWGRPLIPLVVGAIGAIWYGALFFIFQPPSTWASIPEDSPIFPAVTAYRAALLMVVAALGAFGAYATKRVVVAGAKALRERDLFGKYKIEEPISRGGMGEVVRAVYCPEGGFERPVAIKRILPHLTADEAVLERFRTEASLGARLTHPNIVAVLDFGRVEDIYFIAMEYMDGPSLEFLRGAARNARYDFPAAFVARVGAQVAAGLNFAHNEAIDTSGKRLRVVHRDLSPGNVLLARSGQVKIADFGIARVLRELEEDQTQSIVGKAAYMAPELLTSKIFDERVDLFALGVLIWELLSGRRLFARDSLSTTINSVLQDDIPDITALRDDLGSEWSTFLRRALARDKAERYQSAAEMERDLRELLEKSEGANDERVVRHVISHLEDSLTSGQRVGESGDDTELHGMKTMPQKSAPHVAKE